jgi:prephenate dehydratase
MQTIPSAPTVRIAYQGAPGAFSEEAAFAFAGAGAALLPCATFADVFAALADGRAGRAAVPIENTLAGTVRDVALGLATREVQIEAETRIRVSHALVAPPGVTLEQLRRVRSHPVALQQCERFFREHPLIEPVAAFDTAGAVAEVVRGARGDEAALAAERAAAIHGGVVLARALEDDPANWTRFLLLARAGEAAPPPAAGPHKLALLFRTAHRPGALWRCLGVFAERGLDLTRIESHPVVGSPFEYEFMVEVVGPGDSPALDEALEALRAHCSRVRPLGRYAPAGG